MTDDSESSTGERTKKYSQHANPAFEPRLALRTAANEGFRCWVTSTMKFESTFSEGLLIFNRELHGVTDHFVRPRHETVTYDLKRLSVEKVRLIRAILARPSIQRRFLNLNVFGFQVC